MSRENYFYYRINEMMTLHQIKNWNLLRRLAGESYLLHLIILKKILLHSKLEENTYTHALHVVLRTSILINATIQKREIRKNYTEAFKIV